MPESTSAAAGHWRVRDVGAGLILFVATAMVVAWQDSRMTVVWDLSYVLDSAARMASGQMPYRDFPLSHAPLTFLLQAVIMHLFGRVFWHHALYAACVGGVGTVVAWRIVLKMLRDHVENAWTIALMLSAPLTVLGIYCILPNPFYDCDCAFAILVSVLLLQPIVGASPPWRAMAAGGAMVVPVFFKQNIGLPYFAAAFAGVCFVCAGRRLKGEQIGAYLWVLSGALAGLGLVLALLQATVGLGNYVHWTVQFAAQRRMPGLASMLQVYQQETLVWTLPAVAVGAYLLFGRFESRRWVGPAATALFGAPFLWTLVQMFLTHEADDRAASLLAVWPPVLIVAAVLAITELRRGPELRVVLPLVVLGAVNGTLLSQQLWGSTYAIWPLLAMLLAGLLALVGRRLEPRLLLVLAGVIAVTLLVGGSFYIESEERLSYADILDGPAEHATLPQLAGMTVHGVYLPAFEELLRFASREIPAGDGLILLPGEDPFYFATGRTPRFPVLLFDPATDPLSPQDTVDEARRRGIRWLVVKRNLQIKDDPMPNRDATLTLLQPEFALYRRLENYDVYRRP